MCRAPRPAALALVGQEGGVSVLYQGAPLGVVPQDEILDAVSRLDTLYRDNRQAGETSESVLARLGRARLSAALSPER
jgi:precorrin-3B synthase